MRDATMTNVRMEGNSGIKQMEFYGKGGGYNCIAKDNVGAPGQYGKVSCYVVLENNTSLTNSPNGCETNNPGAVDTSAFPAVKMASPMKDTLFTTAPPSYQLEAQVIRGVADSVVFYRDATVKIGKGISAGDGLWVYTWTPPTLDGKYFITANSYYTPSVGAKVRLKAQPILFEINDGNPLINNPEDTILATKPVFSKAKAPVYLYPNPTSSSFSLQVPNDEKILHLEALDVTGRSRMLQPSSAWNAFQTDGLPNGMYTLRLVTASGTYYSRLVKK
jgi:hypothetical protein